MVTHDLPTAALAVSRWCRERPNAVAIIEYDVCYTYEMLGQSIARMTRVLAEVGVRPGVLVGIECDTRLLHMVLILAVEVLGAAHAAMGAADLTLDGELARRCDLLCVTTINDDVARHERLIHLSTDFVHRMVRTPTDAGAFASLSNAWPADDVVRIGRTSGTTGAPKFLSYTRKSLREIVDIVPHLLKYDRARQNFISPYGFFQMGTYADSMSAFEHGATVIYCMGADLAASARKLTAAHTFLVVRDALALLTSEQFRDDPVDRLAVRVVGGLVPPASLATLRRTVSAHVRVAYSTNETSFLTIDEGDGTASLLPDVEVKIVDDALIEKPPGEAGGIIVRTPRMAAGYPWDPAETAARFIDGWYRTSDIGFMPSPESLVVLGRSDGVINLGGIKFAPEPIEQQIRDMGAAIDAALIGLDNAFGTGELHIFIEHGAPTSDRATRAAIMPLVSGLVSSFTIHYVTELPRTETGKVRRHLLKQTLTRDRAI